ncbi:MAG TPA: response regulator [Kofleriaceae bacterium]|nr:response regulator [Kofleriaceae bacterium]
MTTGKPQPQRTSRPMTAQPDGGAYGQSIMRELVGAEVLVIDKDAGVRTGMTELLSAADLHVTGVDDPSHAWELLDARFFSVIVVDLDTPAPNAGLETIATVRLAAPTSAIVVLTPRKSYDDAVAAVRAGAIDVILKSPDAVGYLKERIHEAAARSLEKRQVGAVLREVRETYDELLKRFMDAERRALDLEDKVSGRASRQKSDGALRILVVAHKGDLSTQMAKLAPDGYVIEGAQSGGEALDRVGQQHYHVAMIADDLDDLPPSMVVRSIKAQSADTMTLMVSRSTAGAVVEMIEGDHKVLLADKIGSPAQLVEKLDAFTEAFRVRERERRYLQAFRERHYDLLRRYAALKTRIERVPGS